MYNNLAPADAKPLLPKTGSLDPGTQESYSRLWFLGRKAAIQSLQLAVRAEKIPRLHSKSDAAN